MNRSKTKRKLLLMGRSGAGKTSMRSMIFANYTANDTVRLLPTIDAETVHLSFLGNSILNVWDCGGQGGFYDNYFRTMSGTIFQEVSVLICVLDCQSQGVIRQGDIDAMVNSVEHLSEKSPTAKVFVMIHKVDMWDSKTDSERKEEVRMFKTTIAESLSIKNIKQSLIDQIVYHETTIFNESLYEAWSNVIHELVPNMPIYKHRIENFCKEIGADEITLFEKQTYLPFISYTKEQVPKNRKRNEITTEQLKTMSHITVGANMTRTNKKKPMNFTLKTKNFHLYLQ